MIKIMSKIVLPLVSLLIALAASMASAIAQNLLVNPGFEAGADRPAGWKLSEGGTGEWSAQAYRGRHGVALQGDGQDSSVWRSDDFRLTPGGLYCLRFFGRVDPGASGGCVVAGTSRVNRDFRSAPGSAPGLLAGGKRQRRPLVVRERMEERGTSTGNASRRPRRLQPPGVGWLLRPNLSTLGLPPRPPAPIGPGRSKTTPPSPANGEWRLKSGSG
jgi:hypothetical protein